MKGYPKPLWCDRSICSVIFPVAFSNIGSPPSPSNPTRTDRSFHSGNTVEMSWSSVKRPFSTHCSAATAVMSLVHDAIHRGVSSESGLSKSGELGSTDWLPYLLEYNLPVASSL